MKTCSIELAYMILEKGNRYQPDTKNCLEFRYEICHKIFQQARSIKLAYQGHTMFNIYSACYFSTFTKQFATLKCIKLYPHRTLKHETFAKE